MSNTLKDKLAEAAAKANALSNDGANNSPDVNTLTPTPPTDTEDGAGTPEVLTGTLAGGSLIPGGTPADPGQKSTEAGLSAKHSYQPVAGDYKNVRLHQVVLRNGTVIKPNRLGYYEASKLNEEAVEALKYYAEKGLVSEVTE